MTLIKWKPRQLSINEFDQMINNIFNDGWNLNTHRANHLPAVDIVEDKDRFVLSADFPGFDKKNINLSIEDINNLKGLEVEFIFEWSPGDMLIFDRSHLHAASSNIENFKTGIATFLKKTMLQ